MQLRYPLWQEDKTSVSVTKKWIGKVGNAVKINLMADGNVKDTVELTEDNQWKHTFIDLPENDSVTNKPIQYTVFEEGTQENGEINIGGTTYKVSTEGDIQRGYLVVNTEKISNGGGSGSSVKKDAGSIIVMKHVIDEKPDLNKAFTFTVTLDDKTITGVYGDMVFEKGVSTFTLKHDEKKTGLYIPKNVAFKVEESDNEGYEVTSKNAEGIIPDNDTIIVSFINKTIKKDIPSNPPSNPGGTRGYQPDDGGKTNDKTPPTEVTTITEVITPTENNTHEKVETSDNTTPDNSNNTEPGVDKPLTNTDDSKLDHVPKTGDSSCINVWIFTAVISFMSFAVFMFTRKRRN